MPGSFLEEKNGPIINKTYIATVVDGIREDVPSGHTRSYKRPVKTEYGVRIDTVYVYPDGREVVR